MTVEEAKKKVLDLARSERGSLYTHNSKSGCGKRHKHNWNYYFCYRLRREPGVYGWSEA